MRLRSVTLRFYRVHRELHLELDPDRTLIGGPNEAGKSTVAEAIHRALFLKARGNTEHHRAMVSARHGGVPEVELCFEARGVEHQLRKRFGAQGTTTLVSGHAPPLNGEAAEAELARLLGVEAGLAGKSAVNQWAHLWVWQGTSANDPLAHANQEQAALLRRLQDSGGAVAMQSEQDARLAVLFASRADSLFTQAGKPRVDSELARAEAAFASAIDAQARAAERLARLRQAIDDFEASGAELARLTTEARALALQRATVAERLGKVEELRRRETAEQAAATAAGDRQAQLDAAHRRILQLRATLEDRAAALAPRLAEAGRRQQARETHRLAFDSSTRAHEESATSTRRARTRRDLAAAWVNRLEQAARVAEMEGRLARAREVAATVADLQRQLATLPGVEAKRIQRLQKLEAEAIRCEAALAGMATGIEVLESPGPVLVGDQPLGPGEERVLTETAEISAGPGLRLRIRPGGGTTLAGARQAAAEAREALRRSLQEVGLETVAAAVETAARRDALSARIQLTTSLLEGANPAALARSLEETRTEQAATEAELERRRAGAPDFALPEDLETARALLAGENREAEAAESHEARLRAAREAARQLLESAEEALVKHRQSLESDQRSVEELRVQLRLLLETHGEDAGRAGQLVDAAAARAATDLALASTRTALAELQPDLLARDQARLLRAFDQASQGAREAETRRAVAQAALRSDGSEDPAATLALATAAAEAARAETERSRRRAEAVRLLDRLFREEQQVLAERFTQPLAERVAGYLACLFGPGTQVRVTRDDRGFTGLGLVRPEREAGRVEFEVLSGGAREQVAAAMRLAMAEVLAADHDGCLPVVFDDAFAHSDPVRVQTLQRMLDLAASRGLQVIVLTCNPSDYAALGARTEILRVSS